MAITTNTLAKNDFDLSNTGASDAYLVTADDSNYFSVVGGNSVEVQVVSKAITVSEDGEYEFRMISGNDIVAYLLAGVPYRIHAIMYRTGGSGTGDVIIWL